MTPGPILIMKAPGCRKLIKFSSMGSGNTFGATFWTDGKCEAPMLQDEPWLRKSPSEGIVFWSDECEEIGQIDFFSVDPEMPEWKNLEYAKEPTQRDYKAALHSGIANTPEKERYIRMRLWWRGNDPIRRGKKTHLSEEHLENLRLFEAILSEEDENQRLMKAEVLRQLSRFDDALHLLEGDFSDDFRHAVLQIRDLASRADCVVAKIT